MPYICETCGNHYRYKRNMKRHKNERHSDIEHWRCVESNCSRKFIRRSYLSKHLVLNHGYTSLRAKETACRAPRGNIQKSAYYEDISEDDSVFDLYDEIDKIRTADETIKDFEVGYLDNIRLEPGDAGGVTEGDENARPVGDEGARPVADESARPVADESARFMDDEMVRLVDDESARPVADESARFMDDENARPVGDENARPVGDEGARPVADESARPVADESAQFMDDESARSMNDESARFMDDESARSMNDESARFMDNQSTRPVGDESAQSMDDESAGPVDDECTRPVDDESARSLDDESARSMDDSTGLMGDENSRFAGDDSARFSDTDIDNYYSVASDQSDSGDGFETDDAWEADFSGDGPDPETDDTDGNETIVISSDGEEDNPSAVEVSRLITKTQTFVNTIYRELSYLDGQPINTVTSYERDYYEKSN